MPRAGPVRRCAQPGPRGRRGPRHGRRERFPAWAVAGRRRRHPVREAVAVPPDRPRPGDLDPPRGLGGPRAGRRPPPEAAARAVGRGQHDRAQRRRRVRVGLRRPSGPASARRGRARRPTAWASASTIASATTPRAPRSPAVPAIERRRGSCSSGSWDWSTSTTPRPADRASARSAPRSAPPATAPP